MQLVPTMDLGISSEASIDFNFYSQGTFTEQINNLSVFRNTPNTLNEDGYDHTEVKISGLAKGTFHKDDRDGKIYFENMDTSHVTSNILENGRVLVPEGRTDVGTLPGLPASGISVECNATKLTMSFQLPAMATALARNVTLYLYR